MRAQAERELLRLCPGTLDDAIQDVIADPALSQSLVDALGMGLTWFNRESQGIVGLVEAFRRQLRQTGRTTYWVWSAGCSMGQEPYSIAIALLEAGARPIILATDLNREHLRIAAKGHYRPSKLDMIPPSLLEKYFKMTASGMRRVSAELQRCVTFALHNFATDEHPPSGWSDFDAVVCRNALIYYEAKEGARIARSLSNALRPRGVIVVGAVERPMLHELKLGTVSAAGIATLTASKPAPQARSLSAPAQTGLRVAANEMAPKADKAPETQSQAPSLEDVLDEADRLTRSQGRSAECIQLLSSALARFPLSAAVHLLLGLSLKREGQTQEALTPLRAARFLDSKGWLSVYHLASCLESENQHGEAQLAYRDTLALLRAGNPGTSSDIPGVGDLRTLASTVAEHCTHRLSSSSAARP